MRIVLGLAVVVVLTGCAADTGPPTHTAERFHAALAAHQGAAACALLAPDTAERLPREGETCAHAITALGLSGGPPRAASRWGDEAQVRLGQDTVFLHHYASGWRVRAAGCTPQEAGRPYDCEVGG